MYHVLCMHAITYYIFNYSFQFLAKTNSLPTFILICHLLSSQMFFVMIMAKLIDRHVFQFAFLIFPFHPKVIILSSLCCSDCSCIGCNWPAQLGLTELIFSLSIPARIYFSFGVHYSTFIWFPPELLLKCCLFLPLLISILVWILLLSPSITIFNFWTIVRMSPIPSWVLDLWWQMSMFHAYFKFIPGRI